MTTPYLLKLITGQRWALYQLADDEETYGDDANGFIIVTEDREYEVSPYAAGTCYNARGVRTMVWHDETEPQAIIDAHNAEMAAIQNR